MQEATGAGRDASTVHRGDRGALLSRGAASYQYRGGCGGAGGVYSGARGGGIILGLYGLRGLQGHLRPFDGALQRDASTVHSIEGDAIGAFQRRGLISA